MGVVGESGHEAVEVPAVLAELRDDFRSSAGVRLPPNRREHEISVKA
jgi:hypothetical protein